MSIIINGMNMPKGNSTKNLLIYSDGKVFTGHKDDANYSAEERKTGRWIEQDDGWDGTYYECSECKEAFTLIDGTPSDNLYNFCPNCGADMRGNDNG